MACLFSPAFWIRSVHFVFCWLRYHATSVLKVDIVSPCFLPLRTYSRRFLKSVFSLATVFLVTVASWRTMKFEPANYLLNNFQFMRFVALSYFPSIYDVATSKYTSYSSARWMSSILLRWLIVRPLNVAGMRRLSTDADIGLFDFISSPERGVPSSCISYKLAVVAAKVFTLFARGLIKVVLGDAPVLALLILLISKG